MLYLACDHRGYNLMQQIINFLEDAGIQYTNVGALKYEKTDSYVEFANAANQKIAQDENSRGIYICGSGIGIAIAANRNRGVRAGICNNVKTCKLARNDDDINVLVLPGNSIKIGQAKKIITAFLNTPFEGGRHKPRVDALKNLQ